MAEMEKDFELNSFWLLSTERASGNFTVCDYVFYSTKSNRFSFYRHCSIHKEWTRIKWNSSVPETALISVDHIRNILEHWRNLTSCNSKRAHLILIHLLAKLAIQFTTQPLPFTQFSLWEQDLSVHLQDHMTR